MKKGNQYRIWKWIISSLVICSLWYLAVTADYTSLTKNTGDTLTATNWNQLVDNVKGIQTDSNGNVGIWTDIASQKLHIKGWGQLIQGSAGAVVTSSIMGDFNPYFQAVDNTNWVVAKLQSLDNIWYTWTQSAHNFSLITWNSAKLSILDSSGNVWIWATTPTAKLHVSGIAGTSGAARFDIQGWVSWHPQLYLEPTANTSWAAFNIEARRASLDANAPLSLNANGGNVWIWTTTPDSKLEIKSGDLSQSKHLAIYRNSDNYASTLSLSRSNWSIETPTAVNVAQTIWAITFDSYDGTGYKMTWMINSKLSSTWGWGSIQFYTTDSSGAIKPNVMIHENSNVWIWTTWPSAKLHVNWNIKIEENNTACLSENAWEIKFSAGQFQWCTGTSWVNLH